jgi:hypothetical protein
VVIGEDVASLVDDEPGAGRLNQLLAGRPLRLLRRPLVRVRLAEEAFEEVVPPSTAGDTALAMSRNVVADTVPVIGALFIGGATVWAVDVGDIPSLEAITMPTASDAMAISTA